MHHALSENKTFTRMLCLITDGRMKALSPAWLIVATLWCLVVSDCEALTCLSCDGISVPAECKTVQRCASGEVCFGEQYKTGSGSFSYILGCRTSAKCRHGHTLAIHVLGKRAADRRFIGDILPETECCYTDLCNHVVGNSTGYKSPRGPLCYTCHAQAAPDRCTSISLCDHQEVCAIYSNQVFKGLYQSSCQNQQVCTSMLHLYGKKRSTLECFRCCTGDLCNDACSHVTLSSACSSSPCVFGTCGEIHDGFECKCTPGYTGTNCEKRDMCHTAPCHHGNCSTNGADYVCTCDPGYTGRDCDTVLPDHCRPSPCHHGNCTSTGDTFLCACTTGYAGKRCEILTPINYCMPDPCLHGTCTSHPDGYDCTCQQGWEGKNCSDVADFCKAGPCIHGQCFSNTTGYTCLCDPGYHGYSCDTFDPCDPSPCLNGTCFFHNATYLCNCDIGYTGRNCEQYPPVDLCASNPCIHGSCSHGDTHVKCKCDQGYEGPVCENKVPVCFDVTPESMCRLVSSLICESRDKATNAGCLHYCGYC